MKTYYFSHLNIHEWENDTNKSFNPKKFASDTKISDGNFNEVERIPYEKDTFLLKIYDTTKIGLNILDYENGKSIVKKEEFDRFFIEISCAILPHICKGLLITNVTGLSVVSRGLGGRRYIDTVIGPLISNHIFKDTRYYSPLSFDKDKMNWTLWGDELREAIIDIPEVGRSSFHGLDLSRKKIEIKNRKLLLNDFLSIGDLRHFKVLNSATDKKRIIGVNRNGTICTSLNLLGMMSFTSSLSPSVLNSVKS